MNRKTLFLFLGVLTLGFAANAQTTDTTHTKHHRFHGAPNDTSFHRFHGASNGYVFHRPGENRFGRNRFGRRHHEFVHYTPDQRKQIMAINKDDRQKREDLFKQDNITLKQYKAGLLALDKEKKAKIEALLTPLQKDQQAASRRLREDRAQLMASTRLDRLRQALNLTDDQVAKLKTGQDNLRTQVQAIRNNDNLLPQEKHQQLKALMTTRNDNFKTILTPDQYSKFQQMRNRHHFGGSGGPGNGPWQGRGGRMS
jgi:Spy/CpxP family protein refolding chaperone